MVLEGAQRIGVSSGQLDVRDSGWFLGVRILDNLDNLYVTV